MDEVTLAGSISGGIIRSKYLERWTLSCGRINCEWNQVSLWIVPLGEAPAAVLEFCGDKG